MDARPGGAAKKSGQRKRSRVGRSVRASSYRQIAPKHATLRPRELKGLDTDLSAIGTVQSSTTGNDDIVVVNLIQQGTGSFNRVGRKVFPQSIRLTAFFRLIQATNTNTSTYLKWALVLDRQSSGAALPNYDAIFAGTAQDGTETSTLFVPIRFDNTDRFRVIKEGKYGLGQGAAFTTGLGGDQVAIDEYINLKGIETVYNATASPMTIAEISSGALYFVARCTDTTNTTVVLVGGNARLRYYD